MRKNRAEAQKGPERRAGVRNWRLRMGKKGSLLYRMAGYMAQTFEMRAIYIKCTILLILIENNRFGHKNSVITIYLSDRAWKKN